MRWTCDSCRRALFLKDSGELGPRRAARVEAHLASCPDCRAYWAEAVTLQEAARRALCAEPDRTVTDRLLRRLASEPAPRRIALPWRGRLVLAAAAAVLVVLGLRFGLRGPCRELDRVASLHAVLAMLTEDPMWTRALLEAEQTRNRNAHVELLARHLLTLEGMAVDELPEEELNGGV